MGSIFAARALYGWRAATAKPEKSGKAFGSAFQRMPTASCDFISRTIRSSVDQERSIAGDGVLAPEPMHLAPRSRGTAASLRDEAPALPGPCAPHIRYSRRHTDERRQAPVRAHGWTAPPENGGHAKRKAWCLRIPPARPPASPSSPCPDGWWV